MINNYDGKNYAEEVKRFEELTNKMLNTFKKKRHDYGPTSSLTFDLFGPESMSIRMFDKLIRYTNLASKTSEPMVEDESVIDTLLDLANYALITILEIERYKKCHEDERCHEVHE